MKIKYLMIVGLILTIMAIGAVSASDNITADDGLAAEDVIDESLVEIDDSTVEEEVMAADSESDSIASDDDHYSCTIQTFSSLDNPFTPVVRFDYDSSVTGNLSVYVNGSMAWSTILTNAPGSLHIVRTISKQDLGINSLGIYDIEVKLNDVSIASGTVEVSDFDFYCSVYNAPDTQYLEYGDILYFSLRIPETCTGSLTMTLNNKTYDVNYKHGEGTVTVDTTGWYLGKYYFLVTYGGDEKYHEMVFERSFDLYPKVSYPEEFGGMGYYGIIMSVGEKQLFTFMGPSTRDGKVEIKVYNSTDQLVDNQNVTLSNGYAVYSLPDLALGEYSIYIDGEIAGFDFSRYISLYIINNNNDVSASLVQSEITEGGYFQLKLSGPVDTMMYVLVDELHIKDIYLYGDEINDAISGLAIGNHRIKVVMAGWDLDDCYSKTFVVTVKAKPAPEIAKMTLKKVKVKKSAKKLVLSATLKINGKAKKGLVVKFKFNKKTYSAKTDAKGIAKVTIKKAVLKKLKAGKKITYQASYGKTVKKLTVKVLK